MDSRERIRTALNFEEADRVPYDLAGGTWTGIARQAYEHLLLHQGLPAEEITRADVIQQIVLPTEKLLDTWGADVRGLFPLTSHNLDVYAQLKDEGDYFEYCDEWGFTHHFPKDGYGFSQVKSPLEEMDFSREDILKQGTWPDARNPERWKGLRVQALAHRKHGKATFSKVLCAGLFEMHQRMRGMEPHKLKKDFGRDMVLFPQASPQEIKDDVKRNMDALAPGGFVFSTVHNIQADVPPQKIEAMWEALQEYGSY